MKNHRRFQNLILILLSFFILTSCTGNGTVTPEPPQPPAQIAETYNTPNVPYVKQEIAMGCLHSTAEMVFKNWGRDDITQESLVDIIKIPGNETYLVNYARDEGFNANIFYTTQDEMNKIIYENDTPLIVKIKASLTSSAGHVILITGYDDKNKTITHHDTGVGANLKMSYSELKALNFNSSNPNEYIAIIICPKNVNPDLPDIYL